ncbi:hypothetical protein RSK20926_09297 [Roseobacter sp. SK209-2-6]|uniref:alanine racemase n=1 Tax=Roseobacter sp. SK209-2-6 TaxID=388739 RepID=UPI0000F3D187|nr:alanine racemase [Roseobacter sp. SK209-2-6]EBA17155.1 hypothetical protein RSK20926_09297 [Roseobacter sp. SK209-2-6]
MSPHRNGSLPDFKLWEEMLRQTGVTGPCLILDKGRLMHNLALARERLHPGVEVRVVAKSLAAPPLLDLAMEQLDARGVMSFSAPMLEELLHLRPNAEHLLGKPLPAPAAARILDRNVRARDQVIWLIDTLERAQQYDALARERGLVLPIAVELDVGLHRGGFTTKTLPPAIEAISTLKGLRLQGAMGYEPHLAKLPALLRAAARRRVESGLKLAREMLQVHCNTPIINTGGSLTFDRYGPQHGVSEVALGSLLVKPKDFGLPATEGFAPALFIATPVLKYMPRNPIPGLEALSPLTGLRNRADLAIYGGYWKASPVYPKDYGYSGIFGRSSNQEVWSGPRLKQSPVGGYAFLRPDQSEAILPEFGELLVVSEQQELEHWPCFSPSCQL